MPDVHSQPVRSKNMAAIKGQNTKPELLVRRSLHSRGLRYRLHDAKLPGKPDLVFPRFRCVVFVNGCFWHGHNCPLFKVPSSRTEFWLSKISQTVKRDERHKLALEDLSWRVGVVWECALRGSRKYPNDTVASAIEEWLKCGETELDLGEYRYADSEGSLGAYGGSRRHPSVSQAVSTK